MNDRRKLQLDGQAPPVVLYYQVVRGWVKISSEGEVVLDMRSGRLFETREAAENAVDEWERILQETKERRDKDERCDFAVNEYTVTIEEITAEEFIDK